MPASAITPAFTTFPLVPLDANTSLFYNILNALLQLIGTAIEVIFLDILKELLFFTPPKQIGPLNRLYETATYLFVLIFSITTLSFITTKTIFPFSPDYDYYTYFSRSFGAIIAVLLGKHVLNAAFVATNTLGEFIYPNDFTLAFAPDQLASIAGALIVGAFILAVGIYSMYNLAITALLLLVGMLAIRTLLLYTVYAFFPLFIAMWHLNIGPLDQSRELAEIAFKAFGILLGIGLLVAGILATGGAIGGAGGAPVDNAAGPDTGNLAKSADCDAPPYPDHCQKTSVMIGLVAYFGSLLLALAATGSALGMLVSVAGSGKAKNTHLKQGSAESGRSPNTVAAQARQYNPDNAGGNSGTEQQQGSPDPYGTVSHTQNEGTNQQHDSDAGTPPDTTATVSDKSDLTAYNDSEKWEGKDIDMDNVTYYDSGNSYDGKMHQQGYLEDENGNRRPYLAWGEEYQDTDNVPTLEHGETYDIKNAKANKYTQGRPRSQPVSEEMINENGEFIEIKGTQRTEISESTPNTPPGHDEDTQTDTTPDDDLNEEPTEEPKNIEELLNDNPNALDDVVENAESLQDLVDKNTTASHTDTVQKDGITDLSTIDAQPEQENIRTVREVTYHDDRDASGSLHQYGTFTDKQGNEMKYSSFEEDNPETLEDGTTYTLENAHVEPPVVDDAEHEGSLEWRDNTRAHKSE